MNELIKKTKLGTEFFYQIMHGRNIMELINMPIFDNSYAEILCKQDTRQRKALPRECIIYILTHKRLHCFNNVILTRIKEYLDNDESVTMFFALYSHDEIVAMANYAHNIYMFHYECVQQIVYNDHYGNVIHYTFLIGCAEHNKHIAKYLLSYFYSHDIIIKINCTSHNNNYYVTIQVEVMRTIRTHDSDVIYNRSLRGMWVKASSAF